MDGGPLPGALDLKVRDLTRWLIEEGARAADPGTLLNGFAEQLLALGLPLVRATLHVQALHSERIGVTRIWRNDRKLEVVYFPHGSRDDPIYLQSPLKHVYDTGEWLELRLDGEEPPAFNIVSDLRTLGVRHYVVAPLLYSNQTNNAVTWATDSPEGFTADQLALLRGTLPVLRTVMELSTLYRTFDDVLRIYAGRGPAKRILSGQVRRGEVTRIESAILFCDMRNFTALSGTMPAEALVTLLNDYYDRVVPAVISQAGEILKYMGDGILAIFPAGEEGQGAASPEAAAASCTAAFEASRAILEAVATRNAELTEGATPIETGIALHYGRAAYGNVGSGERLDFTVIGRDVNLTSRISSLCSVLERPILMSETFSQRIGRDCCAVGSFELRGIDGWTTVHAPELEACGDSGSGGRG